MIFKDTLNLAITYSKVNDRFLVIQGIINGEMFDLFVVYMQELFEYLWRKQISLSMDLRLFCVK